MKIVADLAVAAAQQAEAGKLSQIRQHIETLYQKREAGYLKEQQDWEQFVQNAQSILDKAASEWNDLRLQPQSALEQADQDQLRFRNLALAKEQQRLREHIDRWRQDLEDLRNREPIDGEKLLDGIQMVLDFAGSIPVLGAGPDVINTIISAGRGNWGDAAINAIAIIPFWGDAAKGGKMLAKAGQEGLQHADEVGAEALHILEKTCFAGGTPILTPNGSKKIEECQIGDLTLTRPGQRCHALYQLRQLSRRGCFRRFTADTGCPTVTPEAWGYALVSFHEPDHFSPHVGMPDMSASFEVSKLSFRLGKPAGDVVGRPGVLTVKLWLLLDEPAGGLCKAEWGQRRSLVVPLVGLWIQVQDAPRCF